MSCVLVPELPERGRLERGEGDSPSALWHLQKHHRTRQVEHRDPRTGLAVDSSLIRAGGVESPRTK
jgi:hypothetical protein